MLLVWTNIGDRETFGMTYTGISRTKYYNDLMIDNFNKERMLKINTNE